MKMQNIKEQKELIEAARERVDEIVSAIKNCSQQSYPAFYESEEGYTASTIQFGHSTRTRTINFGGCYANRKSVLFAIQREEDEMNELISKGLGIYV